MKIGFWGAARVVTGSCFLLETNGHKILIDCGMFQGSRRIREKNFENFSFSPSEIDCVLLTHAHVDHSGLLPKLCHEGFQGPIYATKATCDLSAIMLPDSAHIQESDAVQINKKGKRIGKDPTIPLYTLEDATVAVSKMIPKSYESKFQISENVTVVFYDAGHILGSAIIVIYVTEKNETIKIVFSGDLGQINQPIIKNPTILDGADYIVLESTYGDRIHPIYDKEEELAEIINDTMDRGGNVVIPSFAVGRTQNLIYYISQLFSSKRIDDIPVIIDSPLAVSASKVFSKNVNDFDDETKTFMNNYSNVNLSHLRFITTAQESMALNSQETSSIIISASGMADAGRILHHLKHNLWRPESTILFVGFQAEGSLGRRLIDGIKRVRVMGEEIAVKAKIKMLEGFSAHADQKQIFDWIEKIQTPKPAKIFIVHGESVAQDELKLLLEKKLGLDVYIPFRGDIAHINGRECLIEQSLLPEVSVEMVMEDFLKIVDSFYRSYRRRILWLAIKNPELVDSLIKTLKKAGNYIKKLFRPYNI